MAAGRVFAGTSGWAYPSWKPGFYPKDVPARRFLEHYASRLNSVEVNYTFRKLPTAAQLEGWLAAVPAEFKFSFKAPEGVTHRKRLRGCDEPVEAFVKALEPVRAAGRLGLLLFQLPPNFKVDNSRLQALLLQPCLQGQRISFEFRNESWFSEETYAVLRGGSAALCIAESDDLKTPPMHTAEVFTSFRSRMAGGYGAAAVAKHARTIKALAAAGRDVYVYYKHEDEPAGPLAAEALLQALRPKKRSRA
jgi:uncharacterized protein YecE (DUF72 family)